MENNLSFKTVQSPAIYPMVTGIFSDKQSTENAYKLLYEKGYKKNDINVIMSNGTHKALYTLENNKSKGNKSINNTGNPFAYGGTIGAIAAVLAAIGTSLSMPGLGWVIAGPIATGLASKGVRKRTASVLSELFGTTVAEEKAELYETVINDGKVVLGVHPRCEEDAEFLEKNWVSPELEVFNPSAFRL